MYHCIKFQPDEVYYLEDSNHYSNRVLSIGFCPICNKPVAELIEYNYSGAMNKSVSAGINANNMMLSLKDSIRSVKKEVRHIKKSKPFGWRYGVNKESKHGTISQYAYDFYGNKELIKKM